MGDLFSHQAERRRASLAPLADRMRPRTLEEFVGQDAILAPGRLLRRAIAADRVGNLILHGPPGTGKTTLARIIAGTTRAHFTSLNAVLAGVKDLRQAVEEARGRLERHGLRTLLFIDEVHRFNSAQQDALLPWVENGTVTLIGATTENPCFEVNKALVSRSRLFRLRPLEPAICTGCCATPSRTGAGLRRAGDPAGDASGGPPGERGRRRCPQPAQRLELAVETTPPTADGVVVIDLAIAEESIQERAVLYDKQGDAHFDTISAFIKSLRGSDPDAALFWLARMVEAGENPRFLFRRMLIAAGEDVGLADPQAIVVVEACAAAFERIGLPEGLYPLAQAALYLAGTEKSNSALGFFDAVKAVRGASPQGVPSHLRDANRDGRAFGDGVGYRYPHAYAEHWVAQQYLPTALQGQVFWQPGRSGWEGPGGSGCRSGGRPSWPPPPSWRESRGTAQQRPRRSRPRALAAAPGGGGGGAARPAAAALLAGGRAPQHRRVLVLEARSLLWALDPLRQATAGGVVLAPATAGDAERIRSHADLLDSLQRPRLLRPGAGAEALADGALDPGEAFEWVVARQPLRGGEREEWEAFLDRITALAAAEAEIRLLFSEPLLGPAGALREAGRGPTTQAMAPALAALQPIEAEWLQLGAAGATPASQGLAARGWTVREESWEETLTLTLRPELLERWFGPAASYRRWLEEQGQGAMVEPLRRELAALAGGSVPQRLRHGGCRPAARP